MATSTSIVVYKGKILFLLRDNKPEISEPNTWQLPGGGVEVGESHEDAIRRELTEEISIVPKRIIYLGSAPGDTKVYFVPLLDEEVGFIKLGNEGQKLEFYSLEEVFKINLTKKLQFYFSEFKDGISELTNNGSVNNLSRLGLLP